MDESPPRFSVRCRAGIRKRPSRQPWLSGGGRSALPPHQEVEMTIPRPLSQQERVLVRWMLQHGEPRAERFLGQLDVAVVSGVCGCGCASVDFQIGDRHADRQNEMTILSDWLYGPDSPPLGAFVFAHGGTLGGLEVYGFGETADRLPSPEELRPTDKTTSEQEAPSNGRQSSTLNSGVHLRRR